MAGCFLARLVIALLAAVLLTPAVAVADEPDAASRGRDWVRANPMVVSALVVSMGTPPRWAAADYLGAFGANAVALWKDGPGEVPGWGTPRHHPRFYTWLDPDGTSVRWDGARFVSTGEVIGGLGPGFPGRIGFQVGDEPVSIADLDAIAAGMARVRAADPEALVFTNFSYYRQNRAELLDHWIESVPGDIQMSGDYFFSPLHYAVLGTFRDSALRKGVPYWQYLNAYVGAETAFERRHTVSDLRWQAFAGLTYGYTGHVWFIYQAAAAGHPSATNWGGSVLHEQVGRWRAPRTPLWDAVAAMNHELAAYGPTMTQLTSTDVRLVTAGPQPLHTEPWTPGAGGDPYLSGVGPVPGQGPLDVLVGHFADDAGVPYVMVQNARHRHSGRVADPSAPYGARRGRIRLDFDFTGAPAQVNRTRIRYFDAQSGEVRRLALQPAGAGRANVDVALDAGEVLLFKYDDTFWFRRGPRPDDVGVVDPRTGTWRLRRPGGAAAFYYGNPGDRPFVGDWDCDGVDTPGLYRPTDGFVYLRNSNTPGLADLEFFFGNPGDVPLAGDFDGDGCDSVSLYRPAEGRFYVSNRLGSRNGGLGAADASFQFGDPGERVLAADFDGDGIDTFALHRPERGELLIRNSLTAGPAEVSIRFGLPDETVVVGNWDGAGAPGLAAFLPRKARFRQVAGVGAGPAGEVFPFGPQGGTPVIGHFG